MCVRVRLREEERGDGPGCKKGSIRVVPKTISRVVIIELLNLIENVGAVRYLRLFINLYIFTSYRKLKEIITINIKRFCFRLM